MLKVSVRMISREGDAKIFFGTIDGGRGRRKRGGRGEGSVTRRGAGQT